MSLAARGRPTVAIIGLGLVGGSLARALTGAGYRVTGIDWPLVVRRATRSGAVSAGATRAEAAAASDVVVLAAPPATNIRLLRRLARVAPPGIVLTDVSSVKREIVAEAARLGLGRSFVGGHPMAGTEKRGFSASSRRLFEGATWWVVPARGGRANRVVRELVRSAGARPVTIDAATHDRTMAFLSHLPQVVAWALRDAAREDRVARAHLRRAGPGYRGMTRLAGSPRPLWRQILSANAGEVARALAALARKLEAESRRFRE